MQAFSNIHPFVTLVYFLSILLISMFVNNPVFSLISLAGAGSFAVLLAGKNNSLRDLKFYLPLFLIVSITNPLFSHNGNTVLFNLCDIPIIFESLIYGMVFGVILISVMLWCKSYNVIMTSDKFIYIFGKAVPKLSLIVTMSLRFVPMLKRQLHNINRTQKAIGLYSSNKYFDKLKNSCNVLLILIGWSLENSVEVAGSMKARGYGLKGRTNYSVYKFGKKDIIVFLFLISLIIVTVIGIYRGYTAFEYYPVLSKISVCTGSVVTYTMFAILAFLPVIIELEGNIRWSFYKSKI